MRTSNLLIDHVWSDIQDQETIFSVADVYWPDYHKPIYCALKLLNIIPHHCYNKLKAFF